MNVVGIILFVPAVLTIIDEVVPCSALLASEESGSEVLDDFIPTFMVKRRTFCIK